MFAAATTVVKITFCKVAADSLIGVLGPGLAFEGGGKVADYDSWENWETVFEVVWNTLPEIVFLRRGLVGV